MKPTDMAVIAASSEYLDRAEDIAERLAIPLNQAAFYQLKVDEQGVSLQVGQQKPMQVDFSWQGVAPRRQQGRQQAIVRACRPAPGKIIVDCTAGWGRDAAVLASFGARVILFERHPVMHLLLEDALARQDQTARQRLQLELPSGDALSGLPALAPTDIPDLIYLDPMHPQRSKSAQVKKDLQFLQHLIGPDSDARQLLELARTITKNRVVVKWPARQQALAAPDFSFDGATVRFDCYNKRR